MTPPAGSFKYKGFVSYSHRDRRWGRWLHAALERYRVPRRLVGSAGRDGPVERRLYPIFRDREELPTAADLGEQITDALRQSACLIVLCSPNSATSQWVNEEILAFKRMGRANRILALIVAGEPNAADKADGDPALECFPPALKFQLDDDGQLSARRSEPIAADCRPQGDGRTNAKLKLIAGMLGVNFDALRRREERRQAIRRFAATSALSALLGAGALFLWQRFDRGVLDAESAPPNSSIIVDDIELGSRIKKFPLRTGAHALSAWAPDHFELRRTVTIRQGQASRARFSLEPALEWPPYKSSAIQGGLILIPGQHDTVLAHNELDQIIFLSTASGEVLARVATPGGNLRSFQAFDVGGRVGRLIVSALDAEQTGPEVLAIRAAPPFGATWRWHGPATGRTSSNSVSLALVRSSDGGTLLALAGRDGHVYLLDAETGAPRGDLVILDHGLAQPPLLIAGGIAGAPSLTLFYRPESGGPTDAPGALAAASVNLDSAVVAWRRTYAEPWEGPSPTLTIADVPHVVVWSSERWQAIDLTTGEPTRGGALPGRVSGAPAFAQLDGYGDADLVFQFLDPALPLLAVRAADGTPRWRGPGGLNPTGIPRNPANEMLRTAAGALLVRSDDALVALDPRDGQVVWKVAGHPVATLTGDWNGDGRDEIFVAMRGAGLLTLDDAGRVLWSVRMEDREAEPWALVDSPLGGAVRSVLVHRHAGMIGVVHGPRILWRAAAPAALQATPVVATAPDGAPIVVEIGNWGNGIGLQTLDGLDGSVRWAAQESFAANRGAALADLGDGAPAIVAIGNRPRDDAAYLMAYRPADGAVTRALRLDVRGWLSCTPAVADFRGTGKPDVAFSLWDARAIIMVDGRTGDTIWRHETAGPNMQGVAAGDLDGDGVPDVAALSLDGALYGLRGKDGALLWRTPIASGGWSTPVITPLDDDGKPQVLVVSQQGRLHVLDGRDGTPVWASEIAGGGKVAGHPVVVRQDGRTLILAPLGSQGVVAFDWASRTAVWRSPAGYPVIASPVVARFGATSPPVVVVGAATGDVWVLEAGDGRPIWHDRVAGGLIEADPVVADLDGDGVPDILIASDDFSLHALTGVGTIGLPK